jgi:transposase InsO family protein
VAFVIDAIARRIVGWRVSRTVRAGFVLDALKQAFTIDVPLTAAASSITAIAVVNMSRPSIRVDWPRRESSLQLAALATATSTRH